MWLVTPGHRKKEKERVGGREGREIRMDMEANGKHDTQRLM